MIDDIGKLSEVGWKWLLRTRLATQLKKGSVSLADPVKVYRRCQPAIATLDTHTAFTDNPIDRVVYTLYGLTDEEVAIVEGSKYT